MAAHLLQQVHYKGAKELQNGRKVIIDYPSANTAKQAHIGHLRPMVIGQAISRLLDFCGADLVRDNHIGDWGTNFGTLIMKIKRDGIDLANLGDEALVTLDQLYKDGSALEAEHPSCAKFPVTSSSCKKATRKTLLSGSKSWISLKSPSTNSSLK